VDDALDTSDLGLSAVSSHSELAALLQQVYIRADRPSLRTLEARTRHGVTPLSKTAAAEMLNGMRLPRKAVMVAFLQACGVPDDGIESWQRTWERVASSNEGQHPESSWNFSGSGPVTLICGQLPESVTSPLGNPADPNYTELLSYADLDALVELHGHIRAENSAMEVAFKLSSKLDQDDLSGHVVLLGGVAWNEITERISEMLRLPVRKIRDPAPKTSEFFVANHDGKEQKFSPKWTTDHGELLEDVGLLARTPNPLNSSRSITICNGLHSRGVLGAVRTLTNARLRESNERYIAENFPDPSTFAILMRVQIIAGKAMTPDFRAADCVLYRWPQGRFKIMRRGRGWRMGGPRNVRPAG
jgi:hypothetical protein